MAYRRLSSSSSIDIVANVQSKQPSVQDDKAKTTFTIIDKPSSQDDFATRDHGDEPLDITKPFPDLPGQPHEPVQFTIRALVVGCVLGAVVSASNMYLCLKTGWTFGASLFGAILGSAILKPSSNLLPKSMGGGYFGPRENVAVQSIATGAGSLSILFEGAVPALYRLNLMSPTPREDFWRLITFTAVCAFYGCFFGVALRKFYIIRLRGIFPTPTASAVTIRSLHEAGLAGDAMRKAKVLVGTFAASCVFKATSIYAPGIIWDWNIAWWIYQTTAWKSIIAVSNWGWYVELTPAFFGVGMLTGINVGLSYLAGSVFAWGIIGPATLRTGLTFGKVSASNPDIISYKSLDLNDPVNKPSARYFLLWPGLMILMCATFTEVAMNAPALYKGLKLVIAEYAERLPNTRRWAKTKDRADAFLLREDHEDDDPVPPNERVPVWMWASGTLLVVIFTCVVLALQYDMNVGLAILSVVLGFLFSCIATQSAATADIAPASYCGKASQLVFGGVTSPGHYSLHDKQLINLVGGIVATGAAAQSTDMVSDLRTGYLLGASHRAQFYGQACGSFVAVWLSVGLFLLFTTAYPCILDASIEEWSFSTPALGAWVAVAEAITLSSLPIPPVSGYLAIAFGVLSIIVVYARYKLIPTRYLKFVPNLSVFGLAFMVPSTQYSIAMASGALFTLIWSTKWRKSYARNGYAVPAGLIAGEGIGGLISALLEITNVGGSAYGSAVGCVRDSYCG
ncbi:Putative oligopeptide transporter, OPT superfamily [Septoria linicola]|uniref:Oligopeptide transporter, OPT superfamily n=1 Tax=Septoria linicola TaxID=215465 RepID=A0A9Q9B071_9PEZI|nr:Putative oligopeptide transporter, OPT superfamily [Septoria linicola]